MKLIKNYKNDPQNLFFSVSVKFKLNKRLPMESRQDGGLVLQEGGGGGGVKNMPNLSGLSGILLK